MAARWLGLSSLIRTGVVSLIVLTLVYDGTADKRPSSNPPQERRQSDFLSTARSDEIGRIERKLKRLEEEDEDEDQRYDDPAEAQEYFLLKRLPVGQTVLPVEKYLKALERMERMPQYSTAWGLSLPSRREMKFFSYRTALQALGTWEPLGPGNIGGRTRALLIDPEDPNTMYAAGVAGGVWKTTNAGKAWTPLTDMIANLAISSMAMDPTNSSVIYAGTGEGYFNSDSIRGAGIFKTTDGGASWVQLASTNNSNFYYVNDIVVSPNDPERVYAATRAGVWRSSDDGATWIQVLDPKVRGGCLDLAIRIDQGTDYLFTSCGTLEQATVYRNTQAEAGGHWIPVLSDAGMGRTTLAIAPSDPDIIYAVAASIVSGTYRNGLHAVFRSNSSGDPGTWSAPVRNTDPTKLNTVLLSNPVYAFLSDCGFGAAQFLNQGWYDLAVAVDPVDPERIWVGGVDLFRSDDGGVNWGMASHWWADAINSRFVHADQHVIVFHPQYNGTTNKTLFVANDGGIFRTDNARAAVATGPGAPCSTDNGRVFWRSLNNGYGVTQFYHGVAYPDGNRYLGGAQDNGTVRGMDQSGLNGWTEIMGGDGGYVAVDPTDPQIIYAETQRGNIQRSTDGGISFDSATAGINDSDVLFITPFIMDPSNSQRLWTGGRFLWRTTSGAIYWTQASTRLPGPGVSAIAVAPTNPNNVMAGTSDGYIVWTTIGLTSNSTTIWSFTEPRTGFVSWITFDPTNANIAYATYSTFGGSHVWKSTNGGVTWKGIDGSGDTGIPDIPVHSIVVDPFNPSRLYVGTDLGVFVSTDSGATWAVENTGFANAVTEALALTTANATTTLFAFTHGRGAWRVTVSGGK
jgi:hypothetical protein